MIIYVCMLCMCTFVSEHVRAWCFGDIVHKIISGALTLPIEDLVDVCVDKRVDLNALVRLEVNFILADKVADNQHERLRRVTPGDDLAVRVVGEKVLGVGIDYQDTVCIDSKHDLLGKVVHVAYFAAAQRNMSIRKSSMTLQNPGS